jgi:methylmalonyl-CoA mutase cobalamin-binding subunit
MSKPLVLGVCLGECVHVGGLLGFLNLAESIGYRTSFLGAAVSVDRLIEELAAQRPDIAAISYRLTPESAGELFGELARGLERSGLEGTRFLFGGTPPVAQKARESGLFEAVFSGGESRETMIRRLTGKAAEPGEEEYPSTLIEHVRRNRPYPLLRHHLGLETVERTAEEAGRIAESRQLDVLSIAPDQNAQQFFFRPAEMPVTGHGAGGVPVRTQADMKALFEASRRGNHPLLRCYAGTQDLLRWAEMSVETIDQAWGAVPIFWYSELDGRSGRPLEGAIHENMETIRWYAGRGIPVEVNDSHQWSLRSAHDAVAVAAAYLAARTAKALGVEIYVSQYMLNTPPDTDPAMDIAKMLAKIELIEGLHDDRFTSLREVRTGLRSMPIDMQRAKGHLAASIGLGMMLAPHIVHVVAFCEAVRAAGADEIIESCAIARGAIDLALGGLPDPSVDRRIVSRRDHLVEEAGRIIEAVRSLGGGTEDPLTDPSALGRAVREGVLDAPELVGSGVAPGEVVTAPVEGGYDAVDPVTGKTMNEEERLRRILRA